MCELNVCMYNTMRAHLLITHSPCRCFITNLLTRMFSFSFFSSDHKTFSIVWEWESQKKWYISITLNNIIPAFSFCNIRSNLDLDHFKWSDLCSSSYTLQQVAILYWPIVLENNIVETFGTKCQNGETTECKLDHQLYALILFFWKSDSFLNF